MSSTLRLLSLLKRNVEDDDVDRPPGCVSAAMRELKPVLMNREAYLTTPKMVWRLREFTALIQNNRYAW